MQCGNWSPWKILFTVVSVSFRIIISKSRVHFYMCFFMTWKENMFRLNQKSTKEPYAQMTLLNSNNCRYTKFEFLCLYSISYCTALLWKFCRVFRLLATAVVCRSSCLPYQPVYHSDGHDIHIFFLLIISSWWNKCMAGCRFSPERWLSL